MFRHCGWRSIDSKKKTPAFDNIQKKNQSPHLNSTLRHCKLRCSSYPCLLVTDIISYTDVDRSPPTPSLISGPSDDSSLHSDQDQSQSSPQFTIDPSLEMKHSDYTHSAEMCTQQWTSESRESLMGLGLGLVTT